MSTEMERTANTLASFVRTGLAMQADVDRILHETIVWIPDRSWWPCAGRKCRGGAPGSCPRPSVASFPRGRLGRRWAYCSAHLYGRKWDPIAGVALIGVAGDSPAALRGYTE